MKTQALWELMLCTSSLSGLQQLCCYQGPETKQYIGKGKIQSSPLWYFQKTEVFIKIPYIERTSPKHTEIWYRWTEKDSDLKRNCKCDQLKCDFFFFLLPRNWEVGGQADRNERWRHRGWKWKIPYSHHYGAPVLPVVEQINTVYPARLCSGTSSTQPLITGYTLINTHTHTQAHTLSHTQLPVHAHTCTPHTCRHAHVHIVFHAHFIHLNQHFAYLRCYWTNPKQWLWLWRLIFSGWVLWIFFFFCMFQTFRVHRHVCTHTHTPTLPIIPNPNLNEIRS